MESTTKCQTLSTQPSIEETVVAQQPQRNSMSEDQSLFGCLDVRGDTDDDVDAKAPSNQQSTQTADVLRLRGGCPGM